MLQCVKLLQSRYLTGNVVTVSHIGATRSPLMSEENYKQHDSSDLFADIERRSRNLLLNGAVHPFKWHENIKGLIPAKKILDLPAAQDRASGLIRSRRK